MGFSLLTKALQQSAAQRGSDKRCAFRTLFWGALGTVADGCVSSWGLQTG
jgi:hypothetical protein